MPKTIPCTPLMLTAQICALLGFSCYAVTLTTLQKQWTLSNFESGLIASAFFLGYILVVPLATVLTDRIDARKIYIFGGVSSVIGLLGMGLFANGFSSAFFFMALNGAGLAGTYMPGLKVLSDRVQHGDVTRHISFYTAFFGVGAGASYLISGWILEAQGWAAVFEWIALGPLTALLIVWRLIPVLDKPEWGASLNIRWADIFPFTKWQMVLRNKEATRYILGYTAHSLELFASRSWLVAFFVFCTVQTGELFIVAATTLAGVINFFGVPASILGNEMAIKIGRQKWISIVMFMSALLGMSLAAATGQGWWIIALLATGHCIFIMADSATLTAGLVTSADPNHKGAAMGLHSIMGFAGGLVGPAIFGYVLDIAGSQDSASAWIWAYFSIVIWGVIFVVLKRRI